MVDSIQAESATARASFRRFDLLLLAAVGVIAVGLALGGTRLRTAAATARRVMVREAVAVDTVEILVGILLVLALAAVVFLLVRASLGRHGPRTATRS
jgi:hypothetical protein